MTGFGKLPCAIDPVRIVPVHFITLMKNIHHSWFLLVTVQYVQYFLFGSFRVLLQKQQGSDSGSADLHFWPLDMYVASAIQQQQFAHLYLDGAAFAFGKQWKATFGGVISTNVWQQAGVLQMWAINSAIENWDAVTNFEVTYSSVRLPVSHCVVCWKSVSRVRVHEPVTQTHRLTLSFRQLCIKLFRLVLRSSLWSSPSVRRSRWTIELESHLMTSDNYKSRLLTEKRDLDTLWVK